MDNLHIALTVIIIIQMVLSHFRRQSCDKLTDAAKREVARNVRSDVRAGINIGVELVCMDNKGENQTINEAKAT